MEKRKLIEVRHFLSKFILILQNNYEIKIQGEYPDVKSQVGNYCHQNALGDEFFKNDFKTAQQTLNSGNFNEDSEGKYFDLLGDVYFKLNQTDQALEQWKKALDKGTPNNMLSKKISDRKYYE